MAESTRSPKAKAEKPEVRAAQNPITPQAPTHDAQAAAVLHLQRTVGNRTVQRVLAEGNPQVIQRHVDATTQAMGNQAQSNLMSKWAGVYLTSANQQSQIQAMLDDITTMSMYTALAEMHPCEEGGDSSGDEPQVPHRQRIRPG